MHIWYCIVTVYSAKVPVQDMADGKSRFRATVREWLAGGLRLHFRGLDTAFVFRSGHK